MTPVVWRIRDRATFASLRRQGQRRRVGPVTVVCVAGSDGPPRVAYAVGRPVGSAVERNRLRRRLRAVVSASGPAPGAYLVSVGPGARDLGFEELRTTVAKAMSLAAGTVPA